MVEQRVWGAKVVCSNHITQTTNYIAPRSGNCPERGTVVLREGKVSDMSITTETRRESFDKVDKNRLYNLILTTIAKNGDSIEGLTAREIAVILHKQGHTINADRQATQPRLTELAQANRVKVIGKKYDYVTQRNVASYVLVG